MTLLGSVIVRGRRGQAKKTSLEANPCLENWVTMTLNLSDKVCITCKKITKIWDHRASSIEFLGSLLNHLVAK